MPSAQAYRVRWRSAAATTWTSRVVFTTEATITSLVAGRPYLFSVSAIRQGMMSPESPEASVAPLGTINPALPAPTVTTLSGGRIGVRWSKAPDATRYQVVIRRDGAAWRSLGYSTSLRYITTGLARGFSYQVGVRAFDQEVPGYYSGVTRVKIR